METQVQLERRMYAAGRARASSVMNSNEEGGRANNNAYASPIYRRFVQPLADLIRDDLEVKRAGKAKAHVALLAPLDPEGVAFLAVRNLLNTLLNVGESHGSRAVVNAVGRSCYHELVLRLFENINPALFYTLTNDLDRRMSKDERHRMTVFKAQASKEGIEFPEWGAAGVTQVGAYLLNGLERLGMVKMVRSQTGTGKRTRAGIEVHLSDDTLSLIDTLKEMTRETMPYFLPCVEQPKDWVAIDDGGFHTDEMRRMHPFAVSARGPWSGIEDHGETVPIKAINYLQSVKWQINSRLLDTVKQVSKHFDMEEVLMQSERPAPPRPEFLDRVDKTEDMAPAQLEQFNAWKREKREWYTEGKLRRTKAYRFETAMRVASEFSDREAIYFVYFADFRGRLYVQTTGVNPQGSDLQKALLRFSEGKPLDSVEAEKWFMCHGANKWGHDKVSLEERVKWVRERSEMIVAFADNPVDNPAWMEADKPLQFLSWCMEYADWLRSPSTFVSHLPIGMDGTCNGLQHFSAMLRDNVGGAATNLVPGPVPNDIYATVAAQTAHFLRVADNDDDGIRDLWLKHGINRTLVKRSVMTKPYGSTRFSCSNFIVGDYMAGGKAPEFQKTQYHQAANYLSFHVWDAINEVVIKASEAMDWLQKAAGQVIDDGNKDIRWTSPSGFPVVQRYQKNKSHRIRTTLCGNAFLRLGVETDQSDKIRHKNGIAPNFVHSYDAAHVHLTVVAAATEGMSLAMIHDDYGTHAADAARLATLLRETFVGMYEAVKPLEDFAELYDVPNPPKEGTLPIREVLKSTYFFA